MGIKHLWTILTPFGERKPLYELQGKTVAVDLSCWICEAQNITDYFVQPKMYLRNIYFRTCYLLLMDVNPVFVLEGKAPELKYDTIAARNALQFKGAKPKTDGVRTGKDRSRFNFVLQQCEEMLGYMGLACVKGIGEAEALCAYLNEDNMVVLARTLIASHMGPKLYTETSQYPSKVYMLQLVVLSTFTTSKNDYSDGVFGIGKEAAMKLFQNIPDHEILDRLRSWRTSEKLYDEYYRKLTNKNICTSCGHSGTLQLHTRMGCNDCITTKGCDFSKFKDKRLEIKNEVSMRSKAIADPSFPNEELVKEFLVRKENICKRDLKWKQPDLTNFVKFTVKHLQWEHLYAFEKFLPVLTRWQLVNSDLIPKLQSDSKIKRMLVPNRIKKIRNPKGIPSYEIIWSDQDNYYKGLIPSDQLADVNVEKLWSTIEPQSIVSKAHPGLVAVFEQSKIKPKKAPKRPRKPKNPIGTIDTMLANTSISEPKPKNSRKLKASTSKPIDSYFKKAVMNSLKADNQREANDSFNLDLSQFGDEEDLDLSDIVQDIVSRAPPTYIQENLDRLGYYVVDSENPNDDLNKSSFFITEAVEDDLFEKSMNHNMLSDSSDDELGSMEEKLGDHKENNASAPDESFSEEYVPLIERLMKNKV